MKATITVVVGLLVFITFVSGAKAEDRKLDDPYPVELQIGEIFKVCKSGMVVCPVFMPICDDTKIIMLVDTPDGLGFKGIAPGTTLCSVGSSVGPRRLFRITVH
jgi:hypothetical protein